MCHLKFVFITLYNSRLNLNSNINRSKPIEADFLNLLPFNCEIIYIMPTENLSCAVKKIDLIAEEIEGATMFPRDENARL